MKDFVKKHAKAYMILSICLLVGVVGISYAYYAASVSNDTVVVGQAGGGNLPLLTISKVSTEANDNLIPIDMDTATLTKAASASPKCVDNNGYSSCQIYSVTVQNNSNITQSYNVNLTRVSGPTTPNVDAVTMGASDSEVTNAASIKNNGLICTTNSVENGETTEPCYFMVLIKNLDEAQTDSGTFTGTVTITSTAGAELKADFGKGEKLTTTIENLYNNAEKSIVTNGPNSASASQVSNNLKGQYYNTLDKSNNVAMLSATSIPKFIDSEPDMEYNYASSVSLMNDRLGSSEVALNDGNIRYYGANPNNYVDIGDIYEQDTLKGNWEKYGFVYSDSASCYDDWDCETHWSEWEYDSLEACKLDYDYWLEEDYGISVDELCSTTTISAGTPILYRIIGLFKDVELADGTKKDLVKVIRKESIGNYSWDQSPEDINGGWGINEWSQADLMKLLNPGYESETVGGSLYWNSSSGTCYLYDYYNGTYGAEPCVFTDKGLSTNAKSKIETVKWNLGGLSTNELFANEIYGYERGNTVYQIGTDRYANDTVTRTTIWPGKVALAYPSDYGYAADFNSCKSRLNDYSSAECTGVNWMYNPMTTNGGSYSWLLTPYSAGAHNVWHVYGIGFAGYGGSQDDVYYGVSPVFYLDSELTIERGTGKSDDPYVLS